jgi:hypothetical protein
MAEMIVPLERQRKLTDVAPRVREQMGLKSASLMEASELRDRSTHTGLQGMSTISGLVDLLASKASTESVAAAIADLVDSSPAALDTLKELATALGNDPNFAATVSAALGNRLRVDAVQALSGAQKNQAAANLGIAPGATANATDAALRDRASHTGEQAMSTVTGLLAALASKATPADIAVAVAGIVDSAPRALDTLKEFADALGNDPNFAATISTALGNRLRFDVAQTLTTGQKSQAAANLGVAPGATANDTDANLKSRANHTGTQPASTISDLTESTQDMIASFLKAGTNITLTYNDAGNELTISASGDISTAASSVTFVAGGGIIATNVQAALAEVDHNNIRDRGSLASGADLDSVTTPGTYQVSSNALAATIVNSPSTQAGLLLVYHTGASVQVTQQYIVWGGAAGGGRIFTRTKHISLGWSAWAGTALQSEIDGKLNAAGGTMTGALMIRSTTATILLDSTAVGSSNLIWGRKNNVARWAIIPGNSAVEPGDDSGSDFALHRYNDAGAFVDAAWRVDRKNGFTASTNGHKWIRCIDISGTSLNSLVEGGKYNGNNLTGTPFEDPSLVWFVEVDRYSAGSGTAIQKAMILSGTTVPMTWVRRRYGSGTWGAWRSLEGFIAPEHFGAQGDGIVDDSNAVEKALRSGEFVQLIGYYQLNRQVVFGTGYSGAGMVLQGNGKRHFLLNSADAGLTFETGAAGSVGSNRQLVARDFIGICHRTDHAAALLKVNGGVGSGATEKTFDIRNVHSFGTDATKGALYGIHLHNGRNGVVDGTMHQGLRNGTPGSMTGAAVYLTGGEDPVGINITNWKAYFCQAGVNVQDTHEGIEISSGEAVMVDYGVLSDLDETVPSGQDEGKPLLKIVNNHFNVHVAGVHMTDVRDYNIANNDFLFQGGGAKIGIWSEARSMATLYGDISGNKFDGSNSTGPVTGVWLQGYSAGGTMGVHVGLNRYVLLSFGLYLGDYARGVTYHGASIYAAVGTPVYTSGSSSSILRYGVPTAV